MIINNLAGGEVEITDVKRFLGGTEYDISDVYFGDKHIFESWRELESPLPITILAAGEDLIDYRIYGASGGVGEEVIITGLTRPLMGLGTCKDTLDLGTGIITRRIGSKEYTSPAGLDAYVNSAIDYIGEIKLVENVESMSSHFVGKTPQGAGWFMYAPGGYVAIRMASPYWLGLTMNSGESFEDFGAFINEQNQDGTPVIVFYTAKESTETVDVPYGLTGTVEGYLTQDTTPSRDNPVYPTANGVKQQDGTYNIHTGIYAIPLKVTASGTTTDYPIYIGDSPLMEDEYVDFGEQKIYRMVNGTLTPTDPPAPIPALPTIEGETIIDYNPSETPAVEPEKMYIKYKPQ